MFQLALCEFHHSISKKRQRIGYLLFAGLSIFTRLNALIYYLPLAVIHLYHIENRKELLRRILILTFVLGSFCIFYDFLYFGKLIVTPWNFVKWNIFENVAENYGTSPFGWYLKKGLVSLGVFYYPFGSYGLITLRKERLV